MARQFTCTYANCQKTTVPIVVSMPDERARFCCLDHAAVAMIRRAWIVAGQGEKADKLMAIEKLAVELIGKGS